MMDTLKIVEMGWKDEYPSEPMTVSDWLLWHRMRLLQIDFSKGRITAEDGKRLKEMYLSEHRQNSTKLELMERSMKDHAERYKSMEHQVNTFRLSPTIELAEEIISTFYGLYPMQ